MREAQTEATLWGLSVESNCSSVSTDPCYPTAEPDEAVFTHNESWEKEKTPLPFKPSKKKHLTPLRACEAEKEGVPHRP